MDFSKIPILKDLDFSDPAKRKNVILVASAGAMIVVLLVVLLVQKRHGGDGGDDPQAAVEEEYQAPEIPEGEDRETLDGKTLRDVLGSTASKGTAGELFDDSVVEDPFSEILEADTGRKFQRPDSLRLGRKDVYPDIPSRDAGQPQSPPVQPYQPVQPYRPDQSAQQDPAAARQAEAAAREAAVRRRMIEMGYDPDTGLPLDGGFPGAEPRAQEPPKEQEPEQEAVQATQRATVRRSGGVSSLGGGVGTSSGISSLGGDDQFVTEDPSHPFKVKFAYDEKLTSGQRVTLRLCEDMVVDGMLIPANTHLFATCSINDRLSLTVTSLNINGNIYSVNLSAFDNDGGEGLYCPRASQDGKRALEEAGQIVSSAVQSAVSAVTGRIVSAGASIVRSKSGDEKVWVTAGYQFYIMQTTK